MLRGRVAQYDVNKGFGFITPDGRGRDVFVHARQLVNTGALEPGQRVEFETGVDERCGKPQAINVRPLDEGGWDLTA
jgi:cold shock CspA family protein